MKGQPDDEKDWEAMPPVGREFGAPCGPQPTKKKPERKSPTFGTPEYWEEMRTRDRWVEAEEKRENDGHGLAPWETMND